MLTELSMPLARNDTSSIMTALVVDNDPATNHMVCILLNALGFHTESATNGFAALERLQAAQPDLIILDVVMPNIVGMEVLKQIRSQSPIPRGEDLSIIITATPCDSDVPITALHYRANDYLHKPFTYNEFMAVMQGVVARLRMTRQNAALRHRLEEKQRKFETELAQAAQVQADVLPHTLPLIPGFELAARCIPAWDVGGDFYDWHMPTPDLLNLTFGDVMGKGIPAALIMASVRAAMRAMAGQTPPHMHLHYARAALEPDLDREGSFVTMFHAQLNVEQRQLTYIDAGHGLSFLWRADGTVESLPERGLPLGILAEEVYAEGCLAFQPGDALILYSDGLVDARVDLGLEPAVLARHLDGATDAQAMVTALVDLVGSVSALPDDLTVVVLRCLPA
jgi:serine phosphatase RsbU (regulator of sigma subunit)